MFKYLFMMSFCSVAAMACVAYVAAMASSIL